jgi:UDP-N-acetylmuramyl pentapeptide phosphotransferase/UDP-N-acetylglucosamine-1-phosphate transferase
MTEPRVRRRGGDPAERLSRKTRRRAVMASFVRSVSVTGVVFVLYFTLPFDEKSAFSTGVALLIGLVVVAVMIVWQARAITRSPFPLVRALEGLCTSFPIVVVLFATTYFVTGEHDPSSFSEPMTRIDSLYFTMTVFATVGFGDITPVSEGARGMVTLQMVVDLVLIGLVARAFVNSVRTGLARRDSESVEDEH